MIAQITVILFQVALIDLTFLLPFKHQDLLLIMLVSKLTSSMEIILLILILLIFSFNLFNLI